MESRKFLVNRIPSDVYLKDTREQIIQSIRKGYTKHPRFLFIHGIKVWVIHRI